MTKNEIILMADASGLSYYGMNKDREKFIYYLEAFATLVAAAEREACAMVCEAGVNADKYLSLTDCAAAIRARGNT
jgi:hypothetical protein